MKPVVIIPTYNERNNITELIPSIFRQSIKQLSVIVVDDHSPDGTAAAVKKLMSVYSVHLIERSKKLGLGSAYLVGFSRALELGATHLVEMDADLSHDPRDLSRLLAAARANDLVIGSRKIPGGHIIGWNLWRIGMSAGAMFFARLLLRLRTKDITSGFRCFQAKALQKISFASVKSNGYAFQEEMLYRAERHGLKIIEIPVTFVDRRHGRSKLSKKDIIEFFVIMIKLAYSRHT